MSSKSSRDSGVRIRRDKLENAIISSFSRTYLMGSDSNPAISGQNLARDKQYVEEKSWRKILKTTKTTKTTESGFDEISSKTS